MSKIDEATQLFPMFAFLDELRDSGVTNMFGAAPYLADAFAMEVREARKVLSMWQRTFDPKQPAKARAVAAIALPA